VLIPTTVPYEKEETTVNAMLTSYDTATYTVIVYGKHSVDDTPEKKHRQLKQLGFPRVFVYAGGLFEWILLQESLRVGIAFSRRRRYPIRIC
jgi:hypothetical protein